MNRKILLLGVTLIGNITLTLYYCNERFPLGRKESSYGAQHTNDEGLISSLIRDRSGQETIEVKTVGEIIDDSGSLYTGRDAKVVVKIPWSFHKAFGGGLKPLEISDKEQNQVLFTDAAKEYFSLDREEEEIVGTVLQNLWEEKLAHEEMAHSVEEMDDGPAIFIPRQAVEWEKIQNQIGSVIGMNRARALVANILESRMFKEGERGTYVNIEEGDEPGHRILHVDGVSANGALERLYISSWTGFTVGSFAWKRFAHILDTDSWKSYVQEDIGKAKK